MRETRAIGSGSSGRAGIRAGLLGMAAALALAGCARPPAAPAGQPVPDPAAFAAAVQRATIPGSPRQATFQWTLDEAGSRVRGRGVVRFEAPERLRLDLFGPRGETYLAAALVGEELRLPAGVPAVELPSPALLWAALGVVRPPAGSPIAAATTTDSAAVLRYATGPAETIEFRLRAEGDAWRLQEVERRERTGVVETVRLEHSPDGTLARTRYRNWSAYRDLILETETSRDVPSFPENIWRPDVASR